jgi:Protein of unknown function (DUF3102)
MTTIQQSNSLADLAARINAEHEAVTGFVRQGLQSAINAGNLLLEAKAQIKHGEWLPWLREHCQIPERTAQHYMRLASHESEFRNVADLTQRGAVAAISEIAPDQATEGKRLANNMLAAHANLMRVIREGLEERRAFAERVYGFPKDWQKELIKRLNNDEGTKWRRTLNGGRQRISWRGQIEHWHSIDDDMIAQAQFETSREFGVF